MKIFENLIDKYIRVKNKERKIKRRTGYLSDKVFYVIRISNINSGLMCLTYHILERLKYTEEKGYIPLIQIGDNHTAYNTYNKLGKFVNIWEYWFEQPTQYSFSDARVADKVIIGEAHHREMTYFCHLPISFVFNKGKLKEACLLYNKYIHISSRILKEIKETYPLFFDHEKRILGVSFKQHLSGKYILRGDYWHPTLNLTVRRIKKYVNTGNYDYIFLSTPDYDAINAFRNEFQDMCLISNRQRTKVTYGSMDDNAEKYSSKYEYGKSYVVDVVLLSMCKDLVGPIDNGTIVSILINNLNYGIVDLFNVGDGNNYADDVNEEIVGWCLKNDNSDFRWTEKGIYGENKPYINDWTI